MPRARATLRTATVAAGLVVAATLSSACGSAPPQPRPTSRVTFVVPASPPAALEALRLEAQSLGGAVTAETADSFTADYGVQSRRVPVPTGAGLWDSRVVLRETEVHSVATYSARPSPAGTVVSVSQQSSYWHPDHRVWLQGPQAVPHAPDVPRELTGSR